MTETRILKKKPRVLRQQKLLSENIWAMISLISLNKECNYFPRFLTHYYYFLIDINPKKKDKFIHE